MSLIPIPKFCRQCGATLVWKTKYRSHDPFEGGRLASQMLVCSADRWWKFHEIPVRSRGFRFSLKFWRTIKEK